MDDHDLIGKTCYHRLRYGSMAPTPGTIVKIRRFSNVDGCTYAEAELSDGKRRMLDQLYFESDAA